MNAKALLLAGLLATVAFPDAARAATSSTWSVTMSNPTKSRVKVTVWYGVMNTSESITLLPGGSYTYHVPGAYCPNGLQGYLLPDDGTIGSILMKETTCLGTYTSGTTWLTNCCWNLDFHVCQVSGPANSTNASDYGFCK